MGGRPTSGSTSLRAHVSFHTSVSCSANVSIHPDTRLYAQGKVPSGNAALHCIAQVPMLKLGRSLDIRETLFDLGKERIGSAAPRILQVVTR
jgi:hypothetical protein